MNWLHIAFHAGSCSFQANSAASTIPAMIASPASVHVWMQPCASQQWKRTSDPCGLEPCGKFFFFFFLLSCFDAAGLRPLYQHLLTVGAHTCIRHSGHKKRPHMKGLSLCLRAAFGGFGCCFLPVCGASSLLWTLQAWADLNWANCATHHQHICARRDIFNTASVEDFCIKCCIWMGRVAVCPPVMRIWVDAQSISVQGPYHLFMLP